MRKLVFVVITVTLLIPAMSAAASAATSTVVAVPSKSAKMICNHEGQKDIAADLGVKPTTVTTPAWTNQVYSCAYLYPNGTVTLSVKELGTKSATKSYVTALTKLLGRRHTKLPIGPGAFWTTNGSVVLAKDTKVLFVDISRLTGQLGVPPIDASDAAADMGAAILGCWTGK